MKSVCVCAIFSISKIIDVLKSLVRLSKINKNVTAQRIQLLIRKKAKKRRSWDNLWAFFGQKPVIFLPWRMLLFCRVPAQLHTGNLNAGFVFVLFSLEISKLAR